MDPISKKAKQWIDNGKDPRSAHWQAALEAMLDLFTPYLVPGKLVPVQELEDADISVYTAILETADLSPNIYAAFLPPSIAGKITPPEAAEELLRIDPHLPSYKIIILRRGEEDRILCAEISPQAKKPGADLFQSGALLGTYDYPNYEECLSGLTQPIRAHLWQKGKWSTDEYRRYTENWFEKLMDIRTANVQVDQSFSYLHSSTIIKGTKVDAIFTLINDYLIKGMTYDQGDYVEAVAAIRSIADAEERQNKAVEFVERGMLECLNVLKDCEAVDFSEFTNTQNEQFKNDFSGTMARLVQEINSKNRSQ